MQTVARAEEGRGWAEKMPWLSFNVAAGETH